MEKMLGLLSMNSLRNCQYIDVIFHSESKLGKKRYLGLLRINGSVTVLSDKLNQYGLSLKRMSSV